MDEINDFKNEFSNHEFTVFSVEQSEKLLILESNLDTFSKSKEIKAF